MPPAGSGYEFFDHTADVGMRVRGATLAELFAHAAQGLVDLVTEGSRVDARAVRTVSLAADSVDALLLAWLGELILWGDTERFLAAGVAFEALTETALAGTVRGERFDPARHRSGVEVKGVTQHQLQVARDAGGWHAQLIFDV